MKSELNFKIIKDGEIYDMDELGIWVEYFHVHSPPNNLTLIDVPGAHGAYLAGSKIGVRDVEIGLQLSEDSIKELDDKKHLIYTLFYSTEPFTIIRDFKNLEIYVIQEDPYDIDNITCSDGDIDIKLKMLDPYLYGPQKTLTFPADIVMVTNKGTAEADPIFELTAKKKTTFAMVSNGDEEYNLIGKPADVDEKVVNEKTLLFDERGDTLNTWTASGTATDNGKVTGSLAADGTGIVVQSYGTTDKDEWHGPALMKEITPIQDFEIEMRCRAETTNANQTYRIEFYLFDEHMNVLGKMAIWDKSAARIQFAAEGRYGPFFGTGIHYPIYSANYLKMDKHFHGMVRMRRIGKRFEFYVARMGLSSSGLHYDTMTKVYNDVANEYQGRLKYVQIHIGKYRGTSNANLPRINAIKAYKHTSAKVDQTPYVMNAGDVLTFDHKAKDILLNGESRKDLKNFGGSFFKLKKGDNMLLVTPEDTFDTKVKFQEKFL